jgi:DNA polymerase-3 subunit epsilon
LLDAEILADVYLAMTGGQTDLGLSFQAAATTRQPGMTVDTGTRPAFLVLRPTEQESSLHAARLAAIQKQSGHCLWLEQETDQA